MFDNNVYSQMFSLKYMKDVPKDYDVSRIQYTFDFIYLVLKRNTHIDSAVKSVATEYGLSESYLMNYLVENKYILSKDNMDAFFKQLNDYSTKALKKILKKHGLKTSGKREKIEKRIFENNLLRREYHLSSKSKVFYSNKKRRIKIYDEYLSENYYFNEFNDFYMDNYRKKEAKIPVEFIKLHINKSIEDENHTNYIINNHIMAKHYNMKENYTKMLDCVLKIFCININPIWKINQLKEHTGLLFDTYDCLIFLKHKLGKNRIINNFYLIWDSFDFNTIIVHKFEAYWVLKDILNIKDYNKLNNKLNEHFYRNEDLKIKRITQKTLFDF